MLLQVRDLEVYRGQPSADELLAAQLAISDHENSIHNVEVEIKLLTDSINRLKDTQKVHLGHIKRHRGIVTLARRLPPEILASIFERCAREGWTHAPIVASQVCSAWRHAASISTVWSYLYLDCDNREVLRKAHNWLWKAKAAPLIVTIIAEVQNSRLEGVMDLLQDCIPQWRSIIIDVATLSAANYILSRFPREAPALKDINVEVAQHLFDADERDFTGFFSKLVKSRGPLSLRLSANILPSTSMIPSSVTMLDLTLKDLMVPTVPEVVDVLEGLPLLRSFTLRLPRRFHTENTAPAPAPNTTRTAEMPNLETMTLVVNPEMLDILANLYTPVLRQLFIRSSADPFTYPHRLDGPNIAQFFHRSDPPLELLELHDVDLTHAHFVECFGSLHSLVELRLHETEISDNVVQLLEGSEGYCPRLKQLDLRWCGQLTGSALVRLVRSRKAAVTGPSASSFLQAQIEQVTIINCSHVGELDITNLARTTTCRVMMRDVDDYCRQKGCCHNERYRQRLRLRQLMNTSVEERADMRLVAA